MNRPRSVETRCALLAALLLASAALCSAQQARYVDVNGLGGVPSDENPGTADQPWLTALKAFRSARPGDTIIFRGGAYRLPRTVHTSDLILEGAGTAPVTFRAAPGEQAVITNLRPIPAEAWLRKETAEGVVYYLAPASKGYRVSNLVRSGMPAKRAHCGDGSNPLKDTPPEKLTGPEQWGSSLAQGEVYLRTEGDAPPGDTVEVCDVGGFGASGNLMYLEADKTGASEPLRLVFEDLIFETGFHGLLVRTGHVTLRNCVLRKSFGDLFNSNSGRFVLEGCEFTGFGESAIDVTAAGEGHADPQREARISSCTFHHGATPRWVGQKGYNAVMLKGGCRNVIVEGCVFSDTETSYGALTLGGASSGGKEGEGINLIARNNIFRNLTGPYVVLFAAATDCRFVNNLITGCKTRNLIRLSRSKGDDPTTLTTRPVIVNNLLWRNELTEPVIVALEAHASEPAIHHNILCESGERFDLNGGLADPFAEPFRSLREAPLFTDADAGDFRPAAGSPTIDAGADLGALVPDDFGGLPRPQGAGADIGPFEGRP